MPDVRKWLWLLIVGSVLALIGVFLPATSDFFDSDLTDAELIQMVDADRAEYLIAFGLMGLGTIIVGIGLLGLGWAIAPTERETAPWRGTVAQVAGIGGVLTALAGLERLVVALFATPEFFVDEGALGDVTYIIGLMIGLTLSMILFGILAWEAPPPKWTAVVLIVFALLGLPAFMPWFVGLLVFAVANLVVMSRSQPVTA
jgi:hypothetical protein